MLSRELAERRIYPAFDLNASATRREELLLSGEALEAARLLRQHPYGVHPEMHDARKKFTEIFTEFTPDGAWCDRAVGQGRLLRESTQNPTETRRTARAPCRR